MKTENLNVMDTSVLVSVILPTFNDAGHIRETINSVLRQSYQNFEVILIDDCSDDETVEVIRQFRDPRIHILENESNLGAAVSRNRGIDASHGDFLAFIDSDDLWEENKLKSQLAFMQLKDVPFTYSEYELIDDKGCVFGKCESMPSSVCYKDLLYHCYPRTSSVMVDVRGTCGGVRFPLIRKRQDYGYFLALLKVVPSAFLWETSSCYYRIRKNSVSSNKFKNIPYHWSLFYRVESLGFVKSCYFMGFWFFRSGLMNSRRLFLRFIKGFGL